MMPASKLFSNIQNSLGLYNEVSVDQLLAVERSRRLRFVLNQSLQGHQEIARWVQKNCRQVTISESTSSGSFPGPWSDQALYDCGE
jgi:hypothetical protein